MNQPDDIRQAVSTSYTRAVEQNPKTGSSCCSSAATQEVLPILAGYGRKSTAKASGCF